MLETLKIKNLAIIDSAEVQFKSGLNILSGETGAGKSIIIEAIALLLGSRATSSLIRHGCSETVIEGVFDVRDLPQIRDRVLELGFPANEDHQLLIKRSIHQSGKHRIMINGELATLSNLQSLCGGLVDLCSQHEHQSLLRSATQLELVDRFGNLEKPREQYLQSFQEYRSLKKEFDRLCLEESTRLQRLDFLRFQIDELESAQLIPGEELKLVEEKNLLQSAQARLFALDRITQLIDGNEDGNLSQLLQLAIHKTTELTQLDERAKLFLESLERALIEIQETSLAVHRYTKSVDLDPARLDHITERLTLITELKRKYGENIEQLLTTLLSLQKEYAELLGAEERKSEIETKLQTSRKNLSDKAKKLSQARQKAAARLSESVTRELQELNMVGARFQIVVSPLAILESEFSTTGADSIEFLVQTNRGETPQGIGKIASGGELSRLMLALRQVISGHEAVGVYLFDEIDSGMGGRTAFQVGKKLKSVSKNHQVLCITHLPQVASFADHHFTVRKTTAGDRTVTEVLELKKSDQKEELARMLGGSTLTKRSLENAAELLELAAC